MDGSFALSLVPSPDPLPAPWWLIEGLEHATFLVHILLANLVMGGVLLALFRRKASGEIVGKLPTLLALTITAGVAPLLFLQVQFGHLWYTASVLMATWWVTLIVVLILGYYALYLRRHWSSVSPGRAQAATAVSFLAFLWTGFLLVNGLSLMLQPQSWTRWFDAPGGLLLNLADASLWPRLLHFLVASVAVAGLFVALLGRLRVRKGAPNGKEPLKQGLRLFAAATAVEVLVGLWYFLAQPSPIRKLFMGRDMLMTALFGLGLVLGIALVVVAWRRRFAASFVLFLATMIVMIVQRALLRAALLAGVTDPTATPVASQYGVLVVFLVILALGVWAVVAMLRWSLTPAESQEGGAR